MFNISMVIFSVVCFSYKYLEFPCTYFYKRDAVFLVDIYYIMSDLQLFDFFLNDNNNGIVIAICFSIAWI